MQAIGSRELSQDIFFRRPQGRRHSKALIQTFTARPAIAATSLRHSGFGIAKNQVDATLPPHSKLAVEYLHMPRNALSYSE